MTAGNSTSVFTPEENLYFQTLTRRHEQGSKRCKGRAAPQKGIFSKGNPKQFCRHRFHQKPNHPADKSPPSSPARFSAPAVLPGRGEAPPTPPPQPLGRVLPGHMSALLQRRQRRVSPPRPGPFQLAGKRAQGCGPPAQGAPSPLTGAKPVSNPVSPSPVPHGLSTARPPALSTGAGTAAPIKSRFQLRARTCFGPGPPRVGGVGGGGWYLKGNSAAPPLCSSQHDPPRSRAGGRPPRAPLPRHKSEGRGKTSPADSPSTHPPLGGWVSRPPLPPSCTPLLRTPRPHSPHAAPPEN